MPGIIPNLRRILGIPKYGQILEMLTCKALFHSLVLLMSLRIAATLATEPGSVAVTRKIRGGISNLKNPLKLINFATK